MNERCPHQKIIHNSIERLQFYALVCPKGLLKFMIIYHMPTHPALLSRNLIGWSSGRIAPSCPMNSAAKQN